MPRLSHAAPKYRKHKATGQAIVTLNGRDHYLGPHGTAASRHEYDRLIAEWIANGRTSPIGRPDETVVELLAAYLRFATGYYRGSDECENIIYAARPLKELYGKTPAAEFSPLKLKAVRQKMIEADLCRNEVNKRIGRIKRMFRWGVENELIPPHVLHGLEAVRGLAVGRSEARESEPVKPVSEAIVDAVRPHVSPQVWAMIQLQRYTGMRPGEVTAMRTCDIDASGKVWMYSPVNHKTAWRGHQRKIYLGPQAQAVLKSWLRTKLDEYLFQPREAQAFRREQKHATRKTLLSCGNRPGSNRKRMPRKTPGERYTSRSYHQAIRTACELAFKMPAKLRKAPKGESAEQREERLEAAAEWRAQNTWHPHQLRHNSATWLRKEFGLDVARVVLGHRSPRITETYAELDEAKAATVMAQVG